MLSRAIPVILLSCVPLAAAALEPFKVVIPVAFEENRGQSRGDFPYLVTHYGAGFSCNTLSLPSTDQLRTDPVAIRIAGAPATCPAQLSQMDETWVHYYGGNHTSSPFLWQRRYKRLRFDSPVAEVNYTATETGIEAVFTFANLETLRSFRLVGSENTLVYATPTNGIYSYAGQWTVRISQGTVRVVDHLQERAITFEVTGADTASPVTLTITMPLALASLAAQTGAFDAEDNWYATGSTTGYSQFDPDAAICFTSGSRPACPDAFVAKFDRSANLKYLVYLKGTSYENATTVAVDPGGNVYVGGSTYSPDFAITRGVLQERFAGPAGRVLSRLHAGGDGFVTKLHGPTGGLIYSTYLGLSSSEWISDLQVDALGRTYMIVSSQSPEFPSWGSPLLPPSIPTCSNRRGSDPAPACSFLVSLDETGSSLRYSKPFSGFQSAWGKNGSKFIIVGFGMCNESGCTSEIYVRGINSDGELTFSLEPPEGLRPTALTLAADATLWISGYRDQPGATPGNFLALMNPADPVLDVITEAIPASNSMQADATGNLWLALSAWLLDPPQGSAIPPFEFVPSPDAPLRERCAGCSALMQIAPSGSILFATYLPGPDTVQVSPQGTVRVFSRSGDSYILDPTRNPAPILSAIHDTISPRAQFKPGNIITIQGSLIGPTNPVHLPLDAGGRVATEVQGVRVLVDGRPAPIWDANRDRLVVIVPLDTPDFGQSTLAIQHNGAIVLSTPIDLGGPGYAILDGPYAPTGTGIRNENGSINTPENPAQPGAVLRFLVAAAGPYDQPLIDGGLSHATLARPKDPPEIRFGMEAAAEILSFAQAPDMPASIMEVRVRLPLELPGTAKVVPLPINFFVRGIPHLHWQPHYVHVARLN